MKRKHIVIISIILIIINSIYFLIRKISNPLATDFTILTTLNEETPYNRTFKITENSKYSTFNVNLDYQCNTKPSDLALCVFIDFEQVKFMVDDKEFEVYQFKANEFSYSKTFEITLDNSLFKKNSVLGIQFLRYNNDTIWKRIKVPMQFFAIYKIYNENGEPLQLATNISNYGTSLNYEADFTVKLNPKQNLKINEADIQYSFKCNPNEDIEIPLYVNTKHNDILFFATLDNRQININGSPYLYYVNGQPGNLILDKIKFRSPETKGKYIINGYWLSQPWTSNQSNIYTTQKIELIVN
jgi:hypothetical protein